MVTPSLKINSLTKRFGSATVLRGTDLQIEAGQVLGLMGPNGAGKSTFIKILDDIH